MKMYDIENATPEQMLEILLSLAKKFNKDELGNPFNYNRGVEYIQAMTFGLRLTKVGGGTDAYHAIEKWFAELKATPFSGFTKKGELKSHSFPYNGTTRKATIEEQVEYCHKKVLRDKYHFLTIIDNSKGSLYQTYKVTGEEMWKVLKDKMIKSWENPKGDPRINATVSTNDLKKYGIQYEVIKH